MSNPPKEKIEYCKFPLCKYSTKSRHMATHITNKHSSLKTTELIPIHDRVPKDGNKIFTSKFQAAKLLDQLEHQGNNVSSLVASVFILEKDNKELKSQLSQLSDHHKKSMDNLTLRIESLEESNTKLSKALNAAITKLELISKLPKSPKVSHSNSGLEEVKSKRVHRQKSRVKRFSRSKLLKSKQLIKEGHK